jgi:teichuronic acid exporter
MTQQDGRVTSSGDAIPAPSEAHLDRAVLHGTAWMGAAKWSTQLVSWVGTILVARILAPNDYGVVAMASVYLGLVALVSEFGIGTTVVTRRNVEGDQLAQFNTVALLLGVGSFLCSILFAAPLGVFFRSEELPLVIVVMSTTFAINALQVVPSATLRRELRFKTLAVIDIVRGLLVPIGTLVLAIIGLRYWALVGGAVLSSVASTAMILANRRHRLARPVWNGLRSNLRMSAEILVGRLAWFVYSSSDLVVAGRRLGEGPLGAYSLAVEVATTPTNKIFALLTEVTPALFAAVQHQRDALRRYFLNMTELLAFVCFPVGVGVSLVASDLVLVLLGPKWSAVAGPLTLLALYSTVRAITPLYGHIFVAAGDSRFAMRTAIVTAVVLPAAFVIGSRWGTTGIAASWMVAHPVLTLVMFARVRRILDLRGRDYLRALRLGLDGTIVMWIAVFALRAVTLVEPPLVRLLAEILLGAVAFTLSTWLLHGARLREIVAWFRRTRAAT